MVENRGCNYTYNDVQDSFPDHGFVSDITINLLSILSIFNSVELHNLHVSSKMSPSHFYAFYFHVSMLMMATLDPSAEKEAEGCDTIYTFIWDQALLNSAGLASFLMLK